MKVLKFFAEWCAPCKMLSKTIEDANIKHELVDIDIDKNNVAAAQYGVRGVPMCIVVDEAGNEVRRKSGMMTKEQFEQFVNVG